MIPTIIMKYLFLYNKQKLINRIQTLNIRISDKNQDLVGQKIKDF